jgi:hypothetical protein
LPEVRDIRRDDVEQLDHDRCDSGEVTRTAVRALEPFSRPRYRHECRETFRIQLAYGRREKEVDAGCPGERGVAMLVALISLEVGSLLELLRVDKQRNHDHFALGAGPTHQRQVSFVKRAHRRH